MTEPSNFDKALAKQRHAASIKSCKIYHPRVQLGLEMMQRARENGQAKIGRNAVIIYGESRSGKTKLLDLYREDFGSDKVLFISLLGNASVDSVASDLLQAAGDPDFLRGTASEKSKRFEQWVADLGTEVVQIDEAHHMIENRSSHVVHGIADWLKSLLNDRTLDLPKRISFVLSGTSKVRDLVDVNDQLFNRFYNPLELQIFGTSTEVDLRDMRALLLAVEKQVPLAQGAMLSSSEMTIRIRLATNGCIGVIMDILLEAGYSAIDNARSMINIGDLAAAYDMLIGSHRIPLGNPFRADPQAIAASAAISYPSTRGLSRGVNRRSRRAKKREVTIGDVLKKGK